jgi:hypothetical protein
LALLTRVLIRAALIIHIDDVEGETVRDCRNLITVNEVAVWDQSREALLTRVPVRAAYIGSTAVVRLPLVPSHAGERHLLERNNKVVPCSRARTKECIGTHIRSRLERNIYGIQALV